MTLPLHLVLQDQKVVARCTEVEFSHNRRENELLSYSDLASGAYSTLNAAAALAGAL